MSSRLGLSAAGRSTSSSQYRLVVRLGTKRQQAALDFSLQHEIEFVPMQWGKWGIEDLAKIINTNAKHLLGMNEPGHEQQSNLSPAEAAALWPMMEQVAHAKGLRLGTPSPAPCRARCVRSSPFQWYERLTQAQAAAQRCDDCDFPTACKVHRMAHLSAECTSLCAYTTRKLHALIMIA